METKNNKNKSVFKFLKIHRTKKAQAAMEFMMTYGWAILIVLIAGAALVYFDVLNPSKFLPETCSIEGFSCDDFRITNGSIQLEISNNLGDDATITEITVGAFNDSTTREILLGQRISIDISTEPGGAGPKGKRFNEEVSITYTTSTSSIEHINDGKIQAEIE